MHYELFKAEMRSQEYLALLKRYNNFKGARKQLYISSSGTVFGVHCDFFRLQNAVHKVIILPPPPFKMNIQGNFYKSTAHSRGRTCLLLLTVLSIWYRMI